MDNNKLKVLKDIKYKLQECCGLCNFGKFTDNNLFGTCTIKKYYHLKHTEKERELSIYKYGWCSDCRMIDSFERDNFFNYLK